MSESIKRAHRLIVAWAGGRKDWKEMGVTDKGYGIPFWGDEIVLKLCWWLHSSKNRLKTTELHILNG